MLHSVRRTALVFSLLGLGVGGASATLVAQRRQERADHDARLIEETKIDLYRDLVAKVRSELQQCRESVAERDARDALHRALDVAVEEARRDPPRKPKPCRCAEGDPLCSCE